MGYRNFVFYKQRVIYKRMKRAVLESRIYPFVTTNFNILLLNRRLQLFAEGVGAKEKTAGKRDYICEA